MTSVKTNYIYSIAYQILSIIVPIFTIPYLSRVFGPKGIGVFSYTTSISQYFTLFAMLGLNNYGTRAVAGIRNVQSKLDKTFSEIWVMQFCFGCFVLLVYLLFILLWGGYYRYIFIILLFQVASSIIDINWLFCGLEQFKITTIRNALVKMLTLLLIFTLIKQPSDLWLYILLYSISIFVSVLVLWPCAYKKVHFIFPTYSGVCCHILPNLIMFIPVIAISVYKYMDKIMLGMQSVEQVGYYENVEKILTVLLSFITAFGSVMLPRITNMIANQQNNLANQYLLKSMRFVMFLGIGFFVGMFTVADAFVPLFFGKGFEKCILIMKIISASAVFSSWANVLRTQYLIPAHKDKVYVISVLLGAIINFLGNVLLIPHYAAVGVVVSTVVAEMMVALVQTLFVYKDIPFRKMMLSVICNLALGGTTFLIFCIFKNLISGTAIVRLIETILIVSFCYVSLCVIFKRYLYENRAIKI